MHLYFQSLRYDGLLDDEFLPHIVVREDAQLGAHHLQHDAGGVVVPNYKYIHHPTICMVHRLPSASQDSGSACDPTDSRAVDVCVPKSRRPTRSPWPAW